MWRIFLSCPTVREISACYVKSFFICIFIFYPLLTITGTKSLENGKGADCSQNSICDQSKFLECDGQEHICGCRSGLGMIWKSDMERCMIMAGAPCYPKGVKGAECISNSSCVDGACECDDDFLDNGFGVCELSYGAVCSAVEKCAMRYLLECSASWNSQQQRTCRCRGEGIEYVWDEQRRKCVNTAGGRCDLDDTYRNVNDKIECIKNSECVDPGVCKCKPGFKQTTEGTCLLKFGEKCNNSLGLVCNYKYEHLICQDGICGCEFYGQQTFQPETQSCKWLVGEDCDITGDDEYNDSNTHAGGSFPRKKRCVKDAFCNASRPGYHKGTCVCMRGFEVSPEKTCTEDRGYGRPCSAAMDCDKKRYLECVPNEDQGSHCNCRQNEMFFDGKECRVLPGKSCRENKLCANQSYCEGQWCVCNEGYLIDTSGCVVPNARRSHSIELPSDPFSHPFSAINCEELTFGSVERKKCQCQLKISTHAWSTEKIACLALVGNECLVDEDCTDHAICDADGQTCQCSVAAHTTTNRTCILKSTVPKDYGNNENAGDWTERMHKLKAIHVDEVSSNEATCTSTFSFKMMTFEVWTFVAYKYFIFL